MLCKLLTDGKYLLCVFAICNLKFVVTALQYWVPHYMRVVLGASEHLTFILVAATVISATAVGSMVGGVITIRCLGSYNNPKAIYLCLGLFALLACAAAPLSFLTADTFGGGVTVYVFIALVWVIMFSHGFIEPIFTGILLSSVEDGNVASSVIVFSQMVLGFIPAPYVYGLLIETWPMLNHEGENQSLWGMRGVTLYASAGILALVLACLIRKKPSTPKSEQDLAQPAMYFEESTYVYDVSGVAKTDLEDSTMKENLLNKKNQSLNDQFRISTNKTSMEEETLIHSQDDA